MKKKGMRVNILPECGTHPRARPRRGCLCLTKFGFAIMPLWLTGNPALWRRDTSLNPSTHGTAHSGERSSIRTVVTELGAIQKLDQTRGRGSSSK